LAQLALNQGKPEAAIAAIEKTLEQKPRTVEPYLVRSAALAEEGRFEDAEKSTLPLIDEFPEPPARAMTFRTLAWARLQQSRYQDAYTFAKESLKYDPSSQEGLYLLGATQIGLNKSDSGIAEVKSYVESRPPSADGYEVLGQLEAVAGHFSGAEQSFQKAVELEPNLVSAQLRLSDLEVAEGKFDDAYNVLSKLVQTQPRLAAAYVRMGQISEKREDWAAAGREYTKALEIEPGNLTAENNLAWDYAEHGGNIDIALRLAQSAKQAAPASTTVSDTLAWILIRKQSYGMAIELLLDCVRQDPANAMFSYHLGVAYFRAGRKPEAAKSLQAALKLESNFANAGDARQMLDAISK
jgi:tetratricopeptide (TPR) repeat protein